MKTGFIRKSVALIIFAVAAGLTPLAAQQEVAVGQAVTTYAPHFFIAVIGGVILAIGFQLLLTPVSVASGISLVGNVEEKFQGKPSGGGEAYSKGDEEKEEGTSTIVKISNAIGVWTIVTASLSLFFASLLAVRLTVVGTVWMGVTLGLIIWAAFFAIMAYLEIRSVSTLIGGVLTAAFSGMRASFASVRNVLAGSPHGAISKAATETASALREELSEAFDESRITEKFDEYVERLKPQPLDLDRVKADVIDILSHVRLEQKAELTEGILDRETFVRLVEEEQPRMKKEDVKRLADSYHEIRETLSKEGRGSGKVEEIVREVSGERADDVAKYQAKVEEYLRGTGREEIDPERIKQDIDEIFEDPRSAPDVILNRLNSIDRETLVAVLAQREGMGEEKARKLVGQLEHAISFVCEKIAGAKGSTSEAAESASGVGGELARLPRQAEDRLRRYLGSIGRPEFDYDRIRLDFERMFHDPKSSAKILRARLKLYNRDSLIALLASRKDVSEEDAERMVRKVEEARDNVLQRAERLDTEVRTRLKEAKERALHEAENVRKASATAAWWMVGTAVVSGVFSALGAAIAIAV